MKKKLLLLVPLATLITLAGCKDKNALPPLPEPDTTNTVDNSDAVLPDEILLNCRTVSLLVNETYQLRGLEQPNCNSDMLEFVSANPSVASIDANGLINGVAVGETTITASVKGHPEVSKVVPVIVYSRILPQTAQAITEQLKEVNEDDLNAIVEKRVYEKTVYKNDVPVSYDRMDQRFTVSFDDAYFRIKEYDASRRTADNGGMIFAEEDLIFYTDVFYDTYAFREAAGSKNYIQVPTQSYMPDDPDAEENRMEPVLAIIDSLFTVGRKYVQNVIDSAKLSDFTDYVGASDSAIISQDAGRRGDNNDALLFEMTVTFDEVAEQSDETNYGIPVGTPMPTVQKMKYTVNNNRLVTSYYGIVEEYTIGEDHYREVYNIDNTFEDIDEEKSQLYRPDRKTFARVDSIFDLFQYSINKN